MAGKKSVGKAKKTIRLEKPLGGHKKSRKARKESYSIYIFKVLKQVIKVMLHFWILF
jgi:hypothetical protein